MSITIIAGLAFLILLFILGMIISIRVRDTSTAFEGSPDERGNAMLKTAYMYLVLLATLMMTIGGSVAAFMAIADIVAPQAYYQTFEQYSRSPEKFTGQPAANLSQEELKKNYEAMVFQQREQVKNRAVNSLIKSFGWIIIPFPVFVYYQRKVKERPSV